MSKSPMKLISAFAIVILMAACAPTEQRVTTNRTYALLNLVENQGCQLPLAQTRSYFLANGFTDPFERVNILFDLHSRGEVSVFEGNLVVNAACDFPRVYRIMDRRMIALLIAAFEQNNCTLGHSEMRDFFEPIGIGPSVVGSGIQVLNAAGVTQLDENLSVVRLLDFGCAT